MGEPPGGPPVTLEREVPGSQHAGRWDPLINELHKLREAVGTPSYESLARKLIEQRITDGQDEHAARIAKSSVHDAFRFGRTRINEALVRDLVRVMNGDPATANAWIAAGHASASLAWSPPVVSEATTPASEPIEPPSQRMTLVLLVACVALNLLGREFVDFFQLPVYLDMTGTAIAAITLGPWRGAAVGASTNIIGVVGSGWVSLPFALVNIVGALVWGYGVRRYDMGRTLPRFFTLNLIAAWACSLIAVPIIALVLDGGLRNGHDAITDLVSESIDLFPVALGFSNLLTSSADKLISGFIALVVISALPYALRARVPLILANDPSSILPAQSKQQ